MRWGEEKWRRFVSKFKVEDRKNWKIYLFLSIKRIDNHYTLLGWKGGGMKEGSNDDYYNNYDDADDDCHLWR